MSNSPPTYEEEVEEGSPFGGAECDESSPEPQPSGADGQTEEHLYPFDSLAVEYYDGAEEASDAKDDEIAHDEAVDSTAQNLDEENAVEQELDTTDQFEEESVDPNYTEIQKSYFGEYMYSNTSSFDEGSNSNFDDTREEPKGSPLGRFAKIAKNVEMADYETLQALYQLLYQRSAWDTQEILARRILEFSGFTFNSKSEDYYNREMMLRTQSNEDLVKIAVTLGLQQVQKMFFDMDGGRAEVISAIMNFVSRPNKRTHAGLKCEDVTTVSAKPVRSRAGPCGCRNKCLKKFSALQQARLLDYMKELKEKRLLEKYLVSLMQWNKIIRDPSETCKKLKEVTYQYKGKFLNKEETICKGAFMKLHDVKMGTMNKLQMKMKSGAISKSNTVEFPPITLDEDLKKEMEREISSKKIIKKDYQKKVSPKKWVSSTEQVQNKLDELAAKCVNSRNEPKVVVRKCSIDEINNIIKEEDSSESKGNDDELSEVNSENVKLKDLSLVVSAIESSSEELLLDVHFLLFLSSADADKVKENILEFDGFSFDYDTEDYDERYEFLQRMPFKLVSEVARSFSLETLSTKERTIKNILTFLTKPDKSFLKITSSMPLSLSDVEIDDFGDMSDSDVSITCEVVEKKVECIDILSSGEDSDREDKPPKEKKTSPQKPSAILKQALTPAASPNPVQVPNLQVTLSAPVANISRANSTPGGKRCLRNFETICKIVNTHPHEYLIDIHELLYLKKHNPTTLRDDILSFTGFDFEKTTPEYVKRKQLLDRMLYNSVRRIYNTLIHNSTEVRVFSKPTMITEIFQFLFNLPPIDTSVRPILPKNIAAKTNIVPGGSVLKNVSKPVATVLPPTGLILPNQSGKLSDLKRVFQRVACFPCEYLVDVHKLLFMTDCDAKVIRNKIFAFKGFDFTSDSKEFQQRKMYLEYLTFHSLRKISSVLTTRSVDLRNSTKHELASHLTQVLAEYCSNNCNNEIFNQGNQSDVSSSSAVENIVVTPIIDPAYANPSSEEVYNPITASISNNNSLEKNQPSLNLAISIVDARSVNSPSISTTTFAVDRRKAAPASVKRKSEVDQSLNTASNTSSEIIVPVECVITEPDEAPPSKKTKTSSQKDSKAVHSNRDAIQSDEEDCDKPLSSLVGHPIDSVIKKHIVDIVEGSDLASITINGVIQKIFDMYPKFDLTYRKELIKSTLRSMLYRLGDKNNSGDKRETNSPDCSVTTTENCDSGSVESPKSAVEYS